MNTSLGRFYGVGVGPGDPNLLTLRAVEVLQSVDIIALPKSRLDRESVAWDIAKNHCRQGVRLLELEMPMTDNRETLENAWSTGAQQVSEELKLGNSVAFITLGDPSLYSTYSYVLKHLMRLTPNLMVETIPGITAMSAAAAKINLPLATGDEPLLVLPSAEDVDKYTEFPNLVLMKVSRRLPQLLTTLSQAKKEAVLLTRIGQKGEEICRSPIASDFSEGKIDYLSLMLVREENE
ncbi:MAG: precorrin-2 C(20)-methyltransferase [Desulfitobacterium hafniense]|nr:precorrin-2 C(20)-methyltransferase [Desulfitobacterium hafniense]